MASLASCKTCGLIRHPSWLDEKGRCDQCSEGNLVKRSIETKKADLDRVQRGGRGIPI